MKNKTPTVRGQRSAGKARPPRLTANKPNRMIITSFFHHGFGDQPLTPEREKNYASKLGELRSLFANGNYAAAFEAMLVSRRRNFSRRVRDGAASGSEGAPLLGWAPTVDQDEFCEIPIWLFGSVLKALGWWIENVPVGPRGQKLSWARQWRQDMVDYHRWDAVRLLLSRGIGFTNSRQGGDRDTIYDKASKYLNGSAAGSPSTVRKCYLKVQKTIKREPWRYHIFNEINFELGPTMPQRAIWWYRKRG